MRPTELLQCPEFKKLFDRYQVVDARSEESGEDFHGCLLDDPFFMDLLDALMEEARCDLGTKIYDQIKAGLALSFPSLPEGWDYVHDRGGGVGAMHKSTQVLIWATPGFECDSDLEVPVHINWPGDPIHYHERWELPVASIAAWHALLFNLCQRLSTTTVTIKARLEIWESPVRGPCVRAVTPWGKYIVDNTEDGFISYDNTIVHPEEQWVHFHVDDQFCALVNDPTPFAALAVENPV